VAALGGRGGKKDRTLVFAVEEFWGGLPKLRGGKLWCCVMGGDVLPQKEVHSKLGWGGGVGHECQFVLGKLHGGGLC